MTGLLSPVAVADEDHWPLDAEFVRGLMEATTGFEPVNRGFADPESDPAEFVLPRIEPPDPTPDDSAVADQLAVAARTFSVALREAMTANGTRPANVARDLGVAPSTVDNWLHGRLPATHRLDELADLLHAPELIKIVLSATHRRCLRCRRKFYANPRIAYKAKYCSSACKRAVGRARKSKAEIAERRLSVVTIQRAIAAYCRGCEPEGICREAACELRKFSPLPLVTRRKAA